MTLSEMLTSLYDDLNNGSTPAVPVTTRYTKYLNDAIRSIVGEPGMVRLLDSDSPYQFTSVAAQARYVLPEAVAEIRHVTERTNDRALSVMSLGHYRRINPDPATNSGTPTHLVPIGPTAVAVQPTNLSSIFAKSTDAADITQTAYLEGLSNGYVFAESKAMNGTTAVQFTTRQYEEITDWYLSAVAAGTVTLHEDSGVGTELARLYIGKTRPRYYALYLHPTPDAAIPYYVDYRRTMVNLVNSTDEPPGPIELHPYYTAYARMREYEKTNDDRYETAAAEAGRWQSRLKYWVLEHPGHLPVAREGGVVTGHSRLGGWYPADSWR